MTKYDCSSGDLNPIGSISKGDLKKLLGWASQVHLPPDSHGTQQYAQVLTILFLQCDWQRFGFTALDVVSAAPPTAELRPIVKVR